jgi:hypothetical protein
MKLSNERDAATNVASEVFPSLGDLPTAAALHGFDLYGWRKMS